MSRARVILGRFLLRLALTGRVRWSVALTLRERIVPSRSGVFFRPDSVRTPIAKEKGPAISRKPLI